MYAFHFLILQRIFLPRAAATLYSTIVRAESLHTLANTQREKLLCGKNGTLTLTSN